MIDTEKTRRLVMDFVRRHSGASFAELDHLFAANGLDWKGAYEKRLAESGKEVA